MYKIGILLIVTGLLISTTSLFSVVGDANQPTHSTGYTGGLISYSFSDRCDIPNSFSLAVIGVPAGLSPASASVVVSGSDPGHSQDGTYPATSKDIDYLSVIGSSSTGYNPRTVLFAPEFNYRNAGSNTCKFAYSISYVQPAPAVSASAINQSFSVMPPVPKGSSLLGLLMIIVGIASMALNKQR